MSDQRGYVGLDLTGLIVAFIGMGVVIGLLLAWLLPVVWSWVKPIIHQLTA